MLKEDSLYRMSNTNMSIDDPTDGSLRVLGVAEIQEMLTGREEDILSAVEQAYVAHYQGRTSLPHSTFLRFPNEQRNRIIALPAYLGEPFGMAGLKWIASFPRNGERHLPRASATIVLNDLETGFPTTVLEGGTISAKRTAAGAALAAKLLHPDPDPREVLLVGAGRINAEILSFLRFVYPRLSRVSLYDSVLSNAQRFARENANADLEFRLLNRAEDAFQNGALVSLATSAPVPHLEDDGAWGAGSTILHVSLRDLPASTILRSINITDDVDHVLRERTSLHLAELQEGHRRFMGGTLERALLGGEPVRPPGEVRPLIFSPFGLGILDLAVAAVVLRRAQAANAGTRILDFSRLRASS